MRKYLLTVFLPTFAEIVTSPLLSAFTKPVLETVATFLLEDFQVTFLPLAFFTFNCTGSLPAVSYEVTQIWLSLNPVATISGLLFASAGIVCTVVVSKVSARVNAKLFHNNHLSLSGVIIGYYSLLFFILHYVIGNCKRFLCSQVMGWLKGCVGFDPYTPWLFLI